MQIPLVTMEKLRKEGYSDSEIIQAMNEIDKEDLQKQYGETVSHNYSTAGRTTPFMYNPNDNLIKFQLELNEILDRTEHILRGDIIHIDESQQQKWINNPKPSENPLNDYGVQEFMRILSVYLTRNTILGNFTPEEVNDIVFDFGKELNDFYFMKYETIGMDTVEKRKNYPIFFYMMKHTVHCAYSRSIGGGERSSLREARQLTQSEALNPLGNSVTVNTNAIPKTRSILNPMRYIMGKQK